MSLTKQKIFDRVKKRLLDGKGRAVNEYDGCEYITANGNRCAVGCLMTKKEAKQVQDADMGDVFDLEEHDFLPKRLVPHIGFLSDLQTLHDYKENWKGNVIEKSKISAVADKWGLNYGP